MENLTNNIEEVFASISTIAPLVVVAAAWINAKIRIKESLRQYTAWLLSCIIAVIGMLLQAGIFNGCTWFQTIVLTFAIALVSNGIFDIKAVKTFLKVLGLDKPKNIK